MNDILGSWFLRPDILEGKNVTKISWNNQPEQEVQLP